MTKLEAGQVINEYICSCGYPAKAMKRLHNMLNAIAYGHDLGYVKEYMRAGDGEVYLLAYLLDDLGLIGHSDTIRRPWLTEKGEALREALDVAKENDYDLELLMEEDKE